MSIIQEALKKVQGPGFRVQGSEQEKENSTGPAPHKKPFVGAKGADALKARLVPVGVLLIILIAVGGFTLKGIVSNSASRETRPAAASQEVIYRPIVNDAVNPDLKPNALEQSLRLHLPGASKYPEFVLNGIMYLEEGPRAIINNAIVEEDSMVNGAKVAKIDRKSVTLLYDDVEITLNLK